MVEGFELLEHTADIGIAARAASWPGLLQQLARGWRRIVCGESEIAATTGLKRTIRGDDREELLVNLLNELIFLLETRNFLTAEIQIDSATDEVLNLQLQGETYDPGRHQWQQEVKAATYHQLKIEQQGDSWQAQVYLDL